MSLSFRTKTAEKLRIEMQFFFSINNSNIQVGTTSSKDWFIYEYMASIKEAF